MGRHDSNIPQDEGYVPSSPAGRVIHSNAENGEVVAYSRDEYGVRKDDGLGLVKPVNSIRGLLLLARATSPAPSAPQAVSGDS